MITTFAWAVNEWQSKRIEFLCRLQQLVNGNPDFRRLGTVDAAMGVKVGPRVFVIIFEAFECIEVREGSEGDLDDLDFFLELSEGGFAEMLSVFFENHLAEEPRRLKI